MIKTDRAAGNQALSAPDSPLLTIPAAQPWFSFFTLRYDGLVTGDNPQYLVSTGNFSAAGSLNITFYTSGSSIGSLQGRIVVFADTVSVTADAPIVAATKLTQGEHQYLLQSDGTTVRLYRCPIVAGVVATEASVVLEGSSTSPFLLKELNGSAFVAGGRADGAANRRSDQSQSRTGFGLGNITLAELARMANGEDLVTNLAKTPVIYSRMSSVTDIADAGPNNFPFTLSGTPTTSAEPAYNFGGTPNPEPSNALTLVMPTNERIYQRLNGSAAVGLSGAIAGAAPTSIELQLYGADGSTIVSAWANANATIGANSWTKSLAVPAGPGKRRAQARSKTASGTVLAESAVSTERFGMGDIQAWIGSSGAERGFTSSSGTGLTPRDDVSYYDGSAWRSFGTVGCAIVAANSLAEQAGVPIGMIDSGQGGSTLASWVASNYAGYNAFAADVVDTGSKLSSCYITVGSNDAASGIVASRAGHAANLRTLIARVRTLTSQPNLLIILGGYNRRTDYSAASKQVFDQQSNWVRMAECDVGDDPNVVHVQNLDFVLSSDGVHLVPTAQGYPASASRTAYQTGAMLYGGTYLRGPKIASMAASGNDVIVTLQHRGSTDFTPASGITGFTGTGFDDLPLTLVSAVRVNATTIKVTWDRPAKTTQYLAGSAPAVGTPVYGNTATPLPMTVETDMAVAAEGTAPVPIITGVTVSPTTATVQGGATRQFNAVVNGQNSPSQDVTWSVSAGAVTAGGLFTAPAATSSAQTITGTAISVQDPNESGNFVVTVPALVAIPDPDPEPEPEPEPLPEPNGRDYEWLKKSVAAWSHRKDLALQIPDFVMLAEERMSGDLEARGVDSVIVLSARAGGAIVALPAGVVTIRSIAAPNCLPLSYLAPDEFNSRYSTGCSGEPRNYTTIGDRLYLGPAPGAAVSLSMSARMSVPPLERSANGLNWLIKRNPALYLAATMLEAMIYLQNDEAIAVWSGKYQIALAAANSTKATAGALVVRTDSRNP